MDINSNASMHTILNNNHGQSNACRIWEVRTVEGCLSCLDELHSSLAAASTRKSVSHWELHQQNTTLALFYMITTQKESIDSCAQWMMMSNNNKDHSDLQTT